MAELLTLKELAADLLSKNQLFELDETKLSGEWLETQGFYLGVEEPYEIWIFKEKLDFHASLIILKDKLTILDLSKSTVASRTVSLNQQECWIKKQIYDFMKNRMEIHYSNLRENSNQPVNFYDSFYS